jgi:hypothetical protein
VTIRFIAQNRSPAVEKQRLSESRRNPTRVRCILAAKVNRKIQV